ncbi:hypothetical protein GCM10022600_15040 [Qipengyuania pelagi]|uniref:Uncharacterized protein n=1 Tax=Qipengyuania pelagi TaxID=994320 RepID=A0A844Y517_9SPHN|nr:hypothetical protein [Qipengyuania pelagi]MXO53640.1 hypothetical protein [Qipengyuania pelagi]
MTTTTRFPGIDRVKSAFERVQRFRQFDASQRVDYLELRQAVENCHALRAPNHSERLAIAFERLQLFPDNQPDEAARWEEFRAAIGEVL